MRGAWDTKLATNYRDTAETRLARNAAGLDAYIRDRRQRGIPQAGLRYGHRRRMSWAND